MKKLIYIFAVIIFSLNAFAQLPYKMSYQAVIRNASNALVTNQIVGMRITILRGSSSGTAVYVETQAPATNSNGLVSIEIGGGTIVSGNFSAINWANGPFFVKTEIAPGGGTNYSITSESQLLSVPYAFYAATAGNISGGGSFAHYIGEQFGGGVIFHLWKDNAGIEHGLIADITDLSNPQSFTWSDVNSTLIGPNAQSTWDGSGNTNAIVTQSGHTSSVASLCLSSTSGGQNDWYLPSLDELSLLWRNRFNVNKTLSTLIGASALPLEAFYWSSTEYDPNFALSLFFKDGSVNNYSKAFTISARAIRAF